MLELGLRDLAAGLAHYGSVHALAKAMGINHSELYELRDGRRGRRPNERTLLTALEAIPGHKVIERNDALFFLPDASHTPETTAQSLTPPTPATTD